jgi:membrane protein involved in colicin uptake
MKNAFASVALAFAALSVSTPALAGDLVADRAAAIRLCRVEVAAQANTAVEHVRFDDVRVRGQLVRVNLDLWRDGQLTNVRCDVSRDGELRVAAIDPAVRLASVQ